MTAILRKATLLRDNVESFDAYPFCIPAIQTMREIEFAEITFFVGENGSGKSSLLEAIAVAAGFNAEGGTKNFQFETARATSALGEFLRLTRGALREKTGFFLRAESYFNLATEIEELDKQHLGNPVIDSYGGVPLHNLSHGESFIALVQHRFGPRGLYLMDEPEAALSYIKQLTLLQHVRALCAQGSQFIVATHSPILLAYPGARIYRFDDNGVTRVEYTELEHYSFYRDFMASPQRFLDHFFDDEQRGGVDEESL